MSRRFFFVVPLVLFAIDFLVNPVFLNICSRRASFTLSDLVVKHVVPLGRLAGGDFYVSKDDITTDTPLFAYAQRGETGLIVSADLTHSSRITLALIASVIDRLKNVSPAAARDLSSFLLNTQMPSGAVQEKRLNLTNSETGQFPVGRLYIVSVDYDSGVEGTGGKKAKVEDGLSKALELANADGVVNLIIPCIAVLPGEPKALQFDQFFPLVFDAKHVARQPKNIYLSLYRQWSEPTLGNAVAQLQTAWEGKCTRSSQDSVFYRENPRLLLLAISLCLLASSFFVPLTLKNFLIIGCFYAGIGYGALGLTDVFANSYNSFVKLTAHVVVLVALAILFPFLASWNPRAIFDSEGV